MSGQLGSALLPYIMQAYRSQQTPSGAQQQSPGMYWNQQPRVMSNTGTRMTGIAPFSGPPGGPTNQGVLPGFIDAFGMRGSPSSEPDIWGRTWYQDPRIGRQVFGVPPVGAGTGGSIGAPGGSTDFDESTGLYRSTGTEYPPPTPPPGYYYDVDRSVMLPLSSMPASNGQVPVGSGNFQNVRGGQPQGGQWRETTGIQGQKMSP